VLYCSGILVKRVWRYLNNSRTQQRRNEIGRYKDKRILGLENKKHQKLSRTEKMSSEER
jgi:hypothetical protein